MKIFISYSRNDASNYAQHVHKVLTEKGYSVFTDVKSIQLGEEWSNVIEKNISKCDIFVIIVTPIVLSSKHIENEIMQAINENKRIIPCFHKYSKRQELKWNLDKYQGIEFNDQFDLMLHLYARIEQEDEKFDETRHMFIKKWQIDGSPQGVAIDSSGYIYVADSGNHRIQKFDSNGNFIAKWGSKGEEDRQFKDPKYLTVDSSGLIYVGDTSNKRIQKFRKLIIT
ncbi:MAG TPA: TIR domain-containing protein [Candidatus Sulfopaludibacter sp.]|nr:TIR domain-containing protein [Candidatus Sulfopaludibacter sp.]